METIATIRLVNNAYHVEVNLADEGLTPVEKEVIAQYGEPVIAAGGTFNDGVSLSYDLNANDRKFPSQFPVKAIFSRADYPSDANARAVLFRDQIRSRIDTAITALRNNSAGTVGKDIDNEDTTPV